MNSMGFDIECKDHLAIITLDNPPANTWTLDNLTLFKDQVSKLSDNNKITGIVIKSASQKFFSAGADLNSFNNVSAETAGAMANAFGEAFEVLTNFKGVSIAAIDGYAMGGGLEVALACDMRFVSSKAKLGLPEAKVGLLPCAGGTQNLTLLVGEGWAKRMILCGEMIDGQTAFNIGLAEVVTESPVEDAVELALRTQEVSPDSLAACKQLIQMGRHCPRWENLVKERKLFVDLFAGSNQQEGVQSFLEKRKPEWDY
ncbi:MAG: enoyl-CoA hydratase [Endozoicomonadaceae bacterium]|nr:enoyl-CoA hydratase [Endozoicomonadaceae bacterium]